MLGANQLTSRMPWGLKRFQQTREAHFLTFSCYRRRPNFNNGMAATEFEFALERVRQDYGLCVYAYVVMPEHVHPLLNEPPRSWPSLSLMVNLAVAPSLSRFFATEPALSAAEGAGNLTSSYRGAVSGTTYPGSRA